MGAVSGGASGRGLVVAVVAVAALVGCVGPVPASGGDRAVAIYRERLRPSGARAAAGTGEEGLAGGASAGAAAPAPESLTADEAVTLAKARSAALAAWEARADAATAKVAAAGALENPQLRVSQLRLDQIAAGKPEERTALRVSVPRPGEIEAKVAVARAEEAEARARAHAEAIAIEADVRWLFDDVVLLEAQIAAADAVAEARRAVADRMKTRLDASEATALEEAMAAMAAVDAEQDRAELAADRSAARAALLERLGLDAGAGVQLVGAPLDAWPPAPLPGEPALVEEALRRRPEIEVAAARVDASDARASLERAKRWPWFSFLEAGYQVGPGIPAGLGWTFQAGVEVPILDTNRAGVAAADAAQAAAKKALDAAVERVAREVSLRLRAARDAATLVTELRARALPVTARAETVVKRALEGQNVDVVRALTVDERRVVLELRLLRALRRHRVAVAELRRAVGGPLPSERASAPAPAGGAPVRGGAAGGP